MVTALTEFDNCLNKGLIRTVMPSRERALKSMEKAKIWVSDAKKALDVNLLDNSLISSYAAMFHSARALLLKDGFREKSHYCLARYLEEKYVKPSKLDMIVVDLLDRYRELRHQDLYSLEFSATKDECLRAIKDAEFIISKVEKLF